MALPDAPQWAIAFAEEMSAHERNGTWVVIDCPPGVRPIDCRWVLKIKRNADGTIERFKARLVAKGFTQRPGIDYFETFAPTAKMAAIRTVLALSAALGLYLRSIDISNAFLNGDIDADVYMRQPEGFAVGGRHRVLKLQKALYGTKQGARAGKIKVQQILVDKLGFNVIHSDASLYVYRNDTNFVLLPFHVDDGTFGSSCDALSLRLIDELSSHFKLRDLGPTTFMLGIAICQDHAAGRVELDQRQYIRD